MASYGQYLMNDGKYLMSVAIKEAGNAIDYSLSRRLAEVVLGSICKCSRQNIFAMPDTSLLISLYKSAKPLSIIVSKAEHLFLPHWRATHDAHTFNKLK